VICVSIFCHGCAGLPLLGSWIGNNRKRHRESGGGQQDPHEPGGCKGKKPANRPEKEIKT
jgi:hypothetical protein